MSVDSAYLQYNCGIDVFDFVSQGRAKKKMEELERLLEIATKNYEQLGGVVKRDQKRQREERETRR
jgi:hypothetical protein